MRLLLRSEEHTSELQSPCNIVCVFCLDRKSTRLNSSHLVISYAVFCLKKKETEENFNQEGRGRPREETRCRKATKTRVTVTWQIDIARVAYDAAIYFFFNDTATTEIYTLSLHDALPI